MKNTLLQTERAAQMYLLYIEKYRADWNADELEAAKHTMGSLTIFCNQLKLLIENSEVLDAQSFEAAEDYRKKVAVYSEKIIDSLKDFV